MEFEIGSFVLASYKTGTYIGKLIENRGAKAVVEVHGVAIHPEQGNLHHPGQSEGIFFHQRRALAYREKALMPVMDLHEFVGDVPDYRISLENTLLQERQRMAVLMNDERSRAWAMRAEEELSQLHIDYGFRNS